MQFPTVFYVPYGRLSRATKKVIFVFSCFTFSLITLDKIMNGRDSKRKLEKTFGDDKHIDNKTETPVSLAEKRVNFFCQRNRCFGLVIDVFYERSKRSKTTVSDFESLLSYIRHPSTLCETALSLGGKPDSLGRIDGDKIICQNPGPALRAPCLVYSFGSNDEWSFEDAIEKFNCRVFTFDPSLKESTFQRGRNIWFYRIGISDVDEDKFLLKTKVTWHMRTLNYIRRHLGHANEIIDVLKLDIEGDEWKVLEQLLDSGELKLVNHLCVEVHLNSMQWRHKKKILQRLEKHGGFRFFSSKKNLVTPMKSVPGIPNKTEQLFYELAWFKDGG